MKNFLSIIILSLFILTGCSTKSTYVPTAGEESLPAAAKFTPGVIKDSSNYQDGEEDKINTIELMRDALVERLMKYKLYGEGYKIDVNIQEYDPGNYFKRFLLPGWGSTKIKAMAIILNPDGKEIGRIPVDRSIGSSGLKYINAKKRCFTDVADQICKRLKQQINLAIR